MVCARHGNKIQVVNVTQFTGINLNVKCVNSLMFVVTVTDGKILFDSEITYNSKTWICYRKLGQ